MFKKLNNVKLVRELIGFILLVVLFKLRPNMLDMNYVIFMSIMFATTIPEVNKSIVEKVLSVANIIFIITTVLILVAVIKKPLSLELVVGLSSLASVKGVKNTIINMSSLLKKSKNIDNKIGGKVDGV